MSRELISQLKKLKSAEISPRADWVQKNRAVLLSQIKNTVDAESESRNFENIWSALSVFMPKQFVYSFVRPLAVLLIVTMVATSGWVTTVDAAYNALPGDWLYPAKRAMEKGQLTVASVVGGKNSETKTRAEFAKRRATEAKQIAKSSDPQKTEKVKRVVEDLKKEIKAVNKNLEELKTTVDSAQTAKDVKKETDQIKDALAIVKTDLIASSSSTVKDVAEAKEMVKDTGMRAVEVLVTKHLDGDKTVTTEDVTKELNTALASASLDASVAKMNVEVVKEVAKAVKTEVREAMAGAVSVGATSTITLDKKVDDIALVTKDAAQKTEQLKATTDMQVGAAQDSLVKGDFVGALNFIKEANSTVTEVEKVSDQTLNAAQTVLPVANVLREAVSVTPVAPLTEKLEAPKIVVLVTTTSAATETVLKVDVSQSSAASHATTPSAGVVAPVVPSPISAPTTQSRTSQTATTTR